MASIKSAPRSALTTFAPDAPYMAAGTVAGAVDLSFSSSAHLEIFKLDFQSDGADLPLAGACPSNERFHRLSWSKPGSGSAENYSLGLIAGGHGDGTIGVWNPLRLISSDQEGVVVASLERHTGSVRGLEFNSLAPNLLASGADGGEICIWDLENPAEPVMFPPLKGMAETSILSPEGPSASDDEIRDLEVSTVQNNKKRLRKDSDAGKKRGVCYLSRVPPHMDPTRLRQILSQYGDIHRIYLVPENPTVQVQRKQVGGFRGKQFSEGWVEFTRRSVAKKVANILNGEQIGGKRRSSFYYDIWNIKYLNKFKWDDLTTETANNNRTREQKLTMEISAAKRERDFYLKKVDQSKALKFMKERMNKKQKVSEHVEEAKVIRRFPQNRLVADRAVQSKPGLSKYTLKEVFGSSSS